MWGLTTVGEAGEGTGERMSMGEFPEARVRGPQAGWTRWSNLFLWLPPIALIAAIGSFALVAQEEGRLIEVRFKQGYGLKVGDPVKHRGIEVGLVEGVALTEDLEGVTVRIRLLEAADGLAREGTQFWIERPQLSLAKLSGLETVVGAKYVGVLPGPEGAAAADHFDGLESPIGLQATADEEIVVQFENGSGLRVGSPVKHRGIIVGEVMSIDLNESLTGVDVRVRLVTRADSIARTGSQFWIELPRFDLTGVRSLETAVTGAYLAVRPGPAEGEHEHRFVGLLQPPIESYRDEGALELILLSDERLGLQAGAPVTYRGLTVGQVVNVGLSSDALQVEARVVVEPDYADLVRENTRFWSTSGLDLNVGLRGINVSLDTLATVAAGGVAFATPDPPGSAVHTGKRFELEADEVERWKSWRPSLVVGSSLLPRGESVPQPQLASFGWQARQLGIKRPRQRTGWATPIAGNLWLAPPNLLRVDGSEEEEADEETDNAEPTLAVGGQETALPLQRIEVVEGIAVFELSLVQPLAVERWETNRLRRPSAPENVAIIVSAGHEPLPIDASRITAAAADRWEIGSSLASTEDWHGASVISREDGKLIGIVMFAEGKSWICPLSEQLVKLVRS